MSAFSDAMRAVRDVLLMQGRIEQLDQQIGKVAADVEGVARLTMDTRERLHALEGYVQAASGAPFRPDSPGSQRKLK